jgi:hypothetical protein
MISSAPSAGFVFVRRAGGAQELDQALQIRIAQMAQLAALAFRKRFVQLLHECQPRCRDGDMHGAAIIL